MQNRFKYEEITPSTLKSFNKSKTIFFVTISPLENHGKHLPYGTDIFEGEGIINNITEKFEKDYPDWNIVLCPPITLGHGAMPGFGSIEIRQHVVRDFLTDYLSSITKLGFKHIFISGFHGNPRHLTAIDEAIIFVNKKYNSNIISPFGYAFMKIFTGKEKIPNKEIEAIFNKNKYDIHGGIFETSLLLHLKPDLVKEHTSMEEINLSVKNPIKKLKAVKKAFTNGYFGNPAGANQEIGENMLNMIVEIFYELLVQSIEDPTIVKKVKNNFHKHPYMRTHFIKKLFLSITFILIPFLWLLKKK
ncbi:MAG: creatininase family protein [Candidatus Sericytochromatia bacterium]